MGVMKKLLKIIAAILFILSGVGVMAFAISLIPQISDWIITTLCIMFFFVGVMLAYSGWRIWQGDSIKEILSDLFISIGR
jgi:membrane protein implicated in regulation of membrane protease activity